MGIDKELLEILVCPKCKGDSEFNQERRWPGLQGMLREISYSRRYSHPSDR